MTTKETGDYGERLAEQYLTARGCRLLARNWRSGHYELDLVMRQGSAIVFVEVKARSNTRYGQPSEYVTARKRKNTLLAARAYLAQNGLTDAPARIDVVEVILPAGQVRHIENAFGESD